MGAATKANFHQPLQWTEFYNTIDGKLETTTRTRHSINPANGEANAEVPVASREDVDRVMEAALKAFKTWATVPYEDRQAALLDFADALEAEKEAFAKMLTQEQGKPLYFAQMELDMSVTWLKGLTNLSLPEHKTGGGDKDIVIRYTPLGVAVGIVPWNYPVLLAVGKIASALVTGNVMVLKPSPFTPACDLKLCELGQRFFPPGVFQCLSGDDSLGPWMTAHPIPAKISFTGSTATGKKVMESASKTLKRVTLELGGKDPAIICEDVNIDEVAPKVATLAFLNSGQICLALKRIFIHEKIFDKFVKAMVKHTETLKVGAGTEEDVFLGPLQNLMQYERVKGFFDDIKKEDQTVAVGGVNPTGAGYFITPTIIVKPGEDSRIFTEEPFGPILPVMSFSTEEEAIAKANNTIYGLGASVWSSNVERANRIAHQLEAGTVWVNTHFELDPLVPFSGHKESGMGQEWGVNGLMSYCNTQTLFLGRNK